MSKVLESLVVSRHDSDYFKKETVLNTNCSNLKNNKYFDDGKRTSKNIARVLKKHKF